MISIVIPSYNYARYLPATIESALAQTVPCEIIVVDDGSTDDSVAVARGYGSRVQVVEKPNGGESSAVHEGFRLARGDLVITLDSDDLLYPDCAETVLRNARPGLAKVQYQLDTIGPGGERLGRTFPHYPPDFDAEAALRLALETGDYPNPPSTGNAFSRALLERILPVPDERFRNYFDCYASKLAPLYGDVFSVPRPLGAYRVHGGNFWARADRTQIWSTSLRHDLEREEVFRAHAARLGIAVPADPLRNNLRHMENRALSLRLTPERHPIPGDRRLDLLARSVRAAFRAPGVPPLGRLVWLAYLSAAVLAPLGLLRRALPHMRGAGSRAAWAWRLIGLTWLRTARGPGAPGSPVRCRGDQRPA